ncbi:hypothetical protein NEMBOFW57_001532 [Staphylotrichum longicolle]|uniref:Uncharacterized protein n=1 Tax=Staphylotrichum longicolle TaxID=669026 RepID=A0AAD4I3V4_9PEZI|nr:hypothetical protein NEMBOFW57_001532 [Staphylotrichum longicolle]
MEMPSPAERIKHYNETRWQFSAVKTGLDDWLEEMMSRHPEHASDHSLSGLGHSSGQVGTKSKELFMAAGKAGKGLFSKGRNKLREKGDRVFNS